MTKAIRYFQAKDGWIRAVTPGFSWVALLLGPTWAFANRAWLLGILLVVGSTSIQFVGRVATARWPVVGLAAALAVFLWMYAIGRYGRVLLAWSLARQGYGEVGLHLPGPGEAPAPTVSESEPES